MTPKLKLSYFDLPGLAHPTRLALSIGQVPFEDHRVQFQDWPSVKPTVPFGQLPVLTVDEKTFIAQSGAILRYAGRLGKLYPEDPVNAAKVDMIIAHLYEFMVTIRHTNFMPQDEKLKARAGIIDNLKKMLDQLESLLETSAGTHAVGDELSIADIYIYCQIDAFKSGFFFGIPTDLANGRPHIEKVYELVKKNPEVVKFETEHPYSMKNI